MNFLISGASKMGLDLTEAQACAFDSYAKELLKWNQRFNLTAIKDIRGIQTQHFLDSLALLPVLANINHTTIRAIMQWGLNAVDVGAGSGFPGLALKILWPDLRLCVIEATAKKINFMHHICQLLGLKEVNFIHSRAEVIGRQVDYRERFDLVVSRAVAPMPTLVEYTLPLAKVSGLVIAYKSLSAEVEVSQARNGIEQLGGGQPRIYPVEIPDASNCRKLVVIQKARPTPTAYPRSNGRIQEHPL